MSVIHAPKFKNYGKQSRLKNDKAVGDPSEVPRVPDLTPCPRSSHGRVRIRIVSDPGWSDTIALARDAVGRGDEGDEDEPQQENGNERTNEQLDEKTPPFARRRSFERA